MIDPERPDGARILDALGVTPPEAEPSRDWLANHMRGGPYPLAGPGWYPGPRDLDRAVALALSTTDAAEWMRALDAVAVIVSQRPELVADADALPWHRCGDRYYRDDDPASPCGAGHLLIADRETFARLGEHPHGERLRAIVLDRAAAHRVALAERLNR